MIDENGLKTTFVSVFNNTPHSFQEIVVQTKFLSENIQRATRRLFLLLPLPATAEQRLIATGLGRKMTLLK
jgi:hypothetical protein